MAEERDEAERTEEPSQRRLEQARERGQVAVSREIGHVFVLSAGLALLVFLAPWTGARLGAAMRALFALAPAGDPSALVLVHEAVGEVAVAVGLWLAILLLAGLAGPFAQNAIVFSAEPLRPRLERISPLAGLRRLISAAALTEFLKNLVKLALVGAAAFWSLRDLLSELASSVALPLLGWVEVLGARAFRLLGFVLVALALVAAVDALWQRFEHRRRLRMTRQEVKEEFRETEGDPKVKQRLRQLRFERARRRMMAEVPKATVVVTNPTHYAVALRYEAATMRAPRVVAKGVDRIALKIVAIARAHGVPVLENPPLARALHAAVEPGQTIPASFYEAVARLIAHVYRLRGIEPSGPSPRA